MAQSGQGRTKSSEPSKRSRVTRKRVAGEPVVSGRVTPKSSARYTPPIPKEEKVSPRWVPVLMFALLGIGMLVIIINYLGLLPGGADNWYLLGGLGLITCGFITATRYR